MIELGGNIVLEGFDDLEPGLLVVIKKMVGSLAKQISEEKGEFDKLEVKKDNNKVVSKISKGDKVFEAESNEKNLFFSLSKSLEELKQKTSF